MEQQKEQFEQSKQGTGSAEQRGQERSRQQNQQVDLPNQERQHIAGEMGKGPNPVASPKDLGALSGRDDAAGGSGDRMEQENTGAATER